jgi:hypothetical protein
MLHGILSRKNWQIVFFFALSGILLSPNVFAQHLPSRYHRYLGVRNLLASWRDSHPDIIKFDTLGYSTRNQVPMLRLKISNMPNIDQDKPAAFICGGVHANEVLGPEVVLGFAQDLIQRYDYGDQLAHNLIDSLEIFIIPFENPEGHIVVENGDFDWRKNKCDNDSNGIFNDHDGVDNNRNYDVGWDLANGPDATLPDSAQYRGTAPFTQSENIAMRDFGMRYHPAVALDYHSPAFGLSEVCYYPWFWRISDGGHGAAPDEPVMASVCSTFASSIVNDAGDSTYRVKRGLVQEGNFITYFYGTFGTTAFTVEVSDTTIQDPTLVDGIVARNIPAIYILLQRALEGRITGVVRDSVTMEPLEAEVRVMERNNADLRPRLTRADFGRYDRLLEPGTYSLGFIKEGYYPKLVGNVVVQNSPVENDVLLVPLYPRPPAPILQFPADGQGMNINQFIFDWSDVDLANRYLLEIANDSLFVNMAVKDSNITASQYSLVSPLGEGPYFWRVKGGNDNGWGSYSIIFRFDINAQSEIDEKNPRPNKVSLSQNYPNPFNSSTVISYSLDRNSDVDLYIFSLEGELTATLLKDKDQREGSHNITWNGIDGRGQRVSSGSYFYELFINGERRSKMMVILK